MAAPPLPTFRVAGESESWMPSTMAVATAAALVTATIFIISREVLWPRWAAVLPNPLKTSLKRMSKDDIKQLIYQPDQFPGARDVETPYGSIRVYEFGPEDGAKVVLVHGITTPCVTLTHIAESLVGRGYRVMLFDLFGRGFSDGVGDLPHDARLYVTQMLLALASSPLSWTGDGSIRVIGYSLGGGIATHFANTFPRMVSSLVLLAPAGLVRAERFGRITRFVFSSGIIPERILARITSQRLQKPLAASASKMDAPSVPTTPAVEVAAAELGNPNSSGTLPQRVSTYVRWMVAHHIGFVPAFMSSIRHAPLMGQHEAWKKLADREPGSTVVILAKRDEIINVDDYERDGLPLLGGEDKVIWRVVPGTHDFVMTHYNAIFEVLDEVWGIKGSN